MQKQYRKNNSETSNPKNQELSQKIRVADTTLRDGDQTPGVQLNQADKVRIAQALEALGVDTIEAGFPASSPGDAAAVQAIARQVKTCEVMALSRCIDADIDSAGKALQGAQRPVMHLVFGVSDIHLKKKVRKSRTEAIAVIAHAVHRARRYATEVQFSLEDATRADPIFMRQAAQTAVEAGATRINLADTVGCTTPEEIAVMVRDLVAFLEGRAVVSVHCHNDIGLATANSIAAIQAGATQVEVTVNGVGERAGNAALEEVAVILHAKGIADTALDLSGLTPLSRMVAEAMQVPVQPNRAIVGANAFSHSSGIHQDGILKDPEVYAFIRPEMVGASGHRMVLTARSGRKALAQVASARGYILSKEQLDAAYALFIRKADAMGGAVPPALLDPIMEQVLSVECMSRVGVV